MRQEHRKLPQPELAVITSSRRPVLRKIPPSKIPYNTLRSRKREEEGSGMTARRDSEQERLERLEREEEDEHHAETERRGEQLRQAWREHHPQEKDHEKGRPEKGGTS